MPFYKQKGVAGSDPERMATLAPRDKKGYEKMLVAVPKDMHSTLPVEKANCAYSMYPAYLSPNPPDVVRVAHGIKVLGVA